MAPPPSEDLRVGIERQREPLDRHKGHQHHGVKHLEEFLSDNDISPDGSYEEVPTLTASELHRRETETKNRIRSNWEALIERISKYGEDEQGDVLDINTLEVVVDKGHLKSLSEKRNNHIWHEDFHDNREQLNENSHRFRVKKALLKSIRGTPEMDDLMLLDRRPSSSERLRAKVLHNQHKEFTVQRSGTPEAEDSSQFKIPLTPRTQLLTSGIDALSIISPSNDSFKKGEKVPRPQTSSRAAVLRRLLIQRAKSRSSTPASTLTQVHQQETKETQAKSSMELSDTSGSNDSIEEDPALNIPLMNRENFEMKHFNDLLLKSTTEKTDEPLTSVPENPDNILREIVNRIDGMSISNGDQISPVSFLEKLKNNERRLSSLIDIYERNLLKEQTSAPLNESIDKGLEPAVINISSSDSGDESDDTEKIEFIRPPLLTTHYLTGLSSQQVVAKEHEVPTCQRLDQRATQHIVKQQPSEPNPPESPRFRMGNASYYSADEGESSHDSSLSEMDCTEAEEVSEVLQAEFSNNEDTERTESALVPYEHPTVGTSENPITFDDDSDSASLYEDARQSLLEFGDLIYVSETELQDDEVSEFEHATQNLPKKDLPISAGLEKESSLIANAKENIIRKKSTVYEKGSNSIENATHNLSKNGSLVSATFGEKSASIQNRLPLFSKIEKIEKTEFLKPLKIAAHTPKNVWQDEPLDNLLKQLSRVDSPKKRTLMTPKRKSDSGPLISTPRSSGHKKLSPLRFSLSPLNSRKRQPSTTIPDTPLRKKHSPVKIGGRKSVFLMDELSTFEDSD